MNKNIKNFEPVKKYLNAELDKKLIFSENKGLSGIYKWTNKETGDTYVGKGVDLTKRLRSYYQQRELETKPRYINKALLKYGHDKFNLEILEYCDKDKLEEREDFYFKQIEPTYNILKDAYSVLGFKHSEETLELLRSKVFTQEHRDNLSKAAKGKVFSEETLNKLSESMKKYRKENPLTPEALENIKTKTTEREGVSVALVNNKTGEETVFKTQTDAGSFLGISRQAIKKGLERESIVGKFYKVKVVNKNNNDSALSPVKDKLDAKPSRIDDDLPIEMPSIFDDVD